ncbi:MAG TPA: DUF6122 family protein [Acidobacteriota bacterium]|nr:DUF6122 family protein [Acidobacteriota bacterium]
MPNSFVHVLANALFFCVMYALGLEPTLQVLVFLLLSNIIDVDHLLAKPIYDKNRNSIGFHFLHKPQIFVIYIAGCFLPGVYKFFFIGVLLHLLLDWVEFKYFVEKKKLRNNN